VLGLFLSFALAVIAAVVARLAPSDEAARIQAEYGHLIVPVVLGPDGLGGPPVDVPTIAALARLAECGQRLILHSRDNSRDTYLVNDEGTVYRYRADPGNVVWGEWSATAPRPLSHAAAPTPRPAVAPRPVTATSMSAASPTVFPPPPFLFSPAAESATEVRAPEPTPAMARSAPAAPAAPMAAPAAPARPAPAAPDPMPSRSVAARPRLRRWVESQAERTRLVRELGSAFLGTSER
jgi:hypothetical protein